MANRQKSFICYCLLLNLFLLLHSCSFHTSTKKSFKPRYDQMDLKVPTKKSTVWIRSFVTDNSDISALYLTDNKKTMSSITVNSSNSSKVPDYILWLFEDSNIFNVVTPDIFSGIQPDYIIEGYVKLKRQEPWWNRIQAIDLWIHAVIFPTLGKSIIGEAEIRLYDNQRHLINVWHITLTDKYIANIWDIHSFGYEDDYRVKVIKYAIEEMKISFNQ